MISLFLLNSTDYLLNSTGSAAVMLHYSLMFSSLPECNMTLLRLYYLLPTGFPQNKTQLE